jgi:hypothetical protein
MYRRTLVFRTAACIATLAALSKCGAAKVTEPVPCEIEWMVATFSGTAETSSGTVQLNLEDSVAAGEIGQSNYQFLRDVLIDGQPASGGSAVADAGFSGSAGRIGLMVGGSQAIAFPASVVGSFVPPGWYRGPIVSSLFPNGVRLFLRHMGKTSTDASGTYTPTSVRPLRGHLNSTVSFGPGDQGNVVGALSFRRSGVPAGCG